MSNRPSHPKKDIEKAIQYAEEQGWRYKKAGNSAHCWGKFMCPKEYRDGCRISIWSTPSSIENHTQQIYRAVKRCPHIGGNNEKHT